MEVRPTTKGRTDFQVRPTVWGLLQQLAGLQAADKLAAGENGGEAGCAGGFKASGVDVRAEGYGAAEDCGRSSGSQRFGGSGGSKVEAEKYVGGVQERGGCFKAVQAAKFKAGMVRGVTGGADQHQVRGIQQKGAGHAEGSGVRGAWGVS